MLSITIFQNPNSDLDFSKLADKLGDIANMIIPFLIALSFVAVLVGIFRYIGSAGDTEKVDEGKRFILWGVVAIFLMLSFWGFVIVIKTSVFGS